MPAPGKDQLLDGNTVFSKLKGDLNRITITGWFQFSNFFNENNIISIYESNLPLLRLFYSNSSPFKFIQQLGNSPSSDLFEPSITANSWIFIKIYVNKIPTTVSNQINLTSRLQVYFQNNKSTFPEQSATTNDIQFNARNFKINVGQFDSYLELNPCCCYLKTLNLYWNDIVDDNDVFGLLGDPSIGIYDAFLKLDFQSYLSNTDYIIDQVGYQDKQYLKRLSQNPSIFNSQESFLLEGLSFYESQGFTLSFFFKIIATPLTDGIILTIGSSNSILSIKIYQNLMVSVLLQAPSLLELQQDMILIDEWAQIIVTISQGLITSGNIILKQKITSKIQPFQLTSQFFQKVTIEFGSSAPHPEYQFSIINIYQGSQLIQTGSCNYQISLTSGNQCIQCKDTYLLDYQNDGICVSDPSFTSSIPGLKDWDPPHTQCPEGMIQEKGSLKCNCRKQFYLKDGKCLRCPKYCNQCIDETTCKSGGDGRIKGNCPNDTFDDGYECLRDYSYTIPNKINKVHVFTTTMYDSTCSQTANPTPFTFSQTFLNLNDNDSFFFNFSILPISSTFVQQTIGYFENQGIIVFKIQKKILFSNYYIQLLDQYDNILCSLGFEYYNIFQISMWTDLRKALFSLYTFQYLYQKEVSIGSSPIYSNPKLCIGPCKISSIPYYCGMMNSNLLFVKNMRLPVEKQQLHYLLYFAQKQSLISCHFIYMPNDPSSNTGSKNQISGSQIFNFIAGSIFHHPIKGFATHKEFSSIITVSQNGLITFSCSIYIEQINQKSTFLQFTFNSLEIKIQLIPHESLQASSILFCYGQDCLSTKKCMIDHQQVTFLMIKYAQKCFYCNFHKREEIEIVINYCRETLLFLKNYSISTFNQVKIGNGSNSLEPFLIYFNHFKIYSINSFFYFSYDLQDPCFIYIDISNLKCLYPKKGYYLSGNEVITPQQCIDKSKNRDILYAINEFSRECQNTQLSSKLCIEYDLLNNQCSKCRDSQYQPASFCKECTEGYFLSKSTNLCQPCNPKCLSCVERSDNCTNCKYSFSSNPPSCECQPNQYLNSNQECVNCQSKCQSCQDSADNCIECSTERINPPLCSCDTYNYKENGFKCEKIICEIQCNNCTQQPNNCQNCKQGRVKPPFCTCDIGYYPIPNGECASCQSGQYFDFKAQKCLQCKKPCTECIETSNNCLGCQQGTQLQDNKCQCSLGSVIISDNGDILCPQPMEVELQIKFKQNQYHLEFVFEHDLKLININNFNPDEIIEIYLHQVPKEIYQISNFSINRNTLSAKIIANKSFQTVNGSALFKNPDWFVSVSNNYILNNSYRTTPIQFQIGPLFLTQTEFETTGLDQVLDSVKNSNENFILLMQQFQVVFYFLNTLQPTVMILLLKTSLPPNLYKFCQLYGMFVYPFVPDYQITDSKKTYSLLGYDLKTNEIQPSSSKQISKLGFTNSLLVNIPLIIIKQIVLLSIISLIFIEQIFTKRKFNINSKKNEYIKKVQLFVMNKVFEENEINLLLTFLSIFSQYVEFQEEKWAYRYGVYLSILQILLLIICTNYVYQNIKNNDQEEMKKIELFTKRLQFNEIIFSNYYFLIQLMKKYVLIFIIFFFYNYPYLVAGSVSSIFLISGIQTYYQKPYVKVRTRIFKIIGELMMFLVWLLLVIITNYEQKLLESVILKQDLIDKYIQLGRVTMIILFAFNLIYFIEFLAPLIEKLVSFFNNNKNNQQLLKVQVRTKNKSID